MIVEADLVYGKLTELYPHWNPSSAESEAIKYRLAKYERTVAEQAVLESYNPAKRVAPVAAVFEACGRIVNAQRRDEQQRSQQATAASLRTYTEQEMQEMMITRARAGEAFAREICRRRKWVWQEKVNSETLTGKGM